MAQLTSSLLVKLVDGVSAPAKQAATALRGIGATARSITTGPSFGGMLGGIAAISAAAWGLQRALRAPVGAAMEFQSAMADVRKVVDFSSAADFQAFQASVIEMSRSIPLAAQGLSQIVAAAGQAGIPRDDLIKFTDLAAKVGVAFDISAKDTGDALAKMMTGLGLTIPQVGLLSDAMNHLSNAQASSAADILDVVRRAGADGKMFGFSAVQTSAFASAMLSAGAQSDVAATSFRNMGRALKAGANATKSQRTAFAELGLNSTKVAKRMQKDAAGTTLDVFERLNKLPKYMQSSIASLLFGDEARALMPLISNLDLLKRSLGLVANETQYAGSAAREYEVRSKTFANSVQLFQNRFEALKIAIGNKLMPVLEPLMAQLGGIFDDFSAALETTDKRIGVFDRLAAAVREFTSGLGIGDLRSNLKALTDGLLGDPAKFESDSAALGKASESFRAMGTACRELAIGIGELLGPLPDLFGTDWKTVITWGIGLGGAAVGFKALGLALRIIGGALKLFTGITLIGGIVSAIGKLVGIGGVGAAASRLGGLGKALKLLSAGIAALSRSPSALAAAALGALGVGLYQNLEKNDRKGKPDPWEVQRQRNLRDAMKEKPSDSFGVPPAGGSEEYYRKRMEERNRLRQDRGLPPVSSPSAPSGGGIGSDFATDLNQRGAAATSGEATGQGFRQSLLNELRETEREAGAIVERIVQKLSFTVTPIIAPRLGGDLGQNMRAIHADTGVD